MNNSQKLKKIQRASGLSQKSIAQKVGVSFATVNSWINNRSLPRQKMQERIDNMFAFYVSGEVFIDYDALSEKKGYLTKKSHKVKNVARMIFSRSDLQEQFMLSLTYNTNRIEGSTLTEDDTAAVLFHNASLSRKTLTEHLEAKNHQAAMMYIFDTWFAEGEFRITEEHILKLHSILMNGILDDAGMYRCHSVRIVGSHVPTANWQSVCQKMKELMTIINDKKKQEDVIAHIAVSHAQFEQIHPFADGNGRIGRLLMHMMALRKNFPPVLIENNRKHVYYQYLQKAQLYNESHFLEDFVCDAINASYDIIENKT